MNTNVTVLSGTELYLPIVFLQNALDHAQRNEKSDLKWVANFPPPHEKHTEKPRVKTVSTTETDIPVKLTTSKHETYLKIHLEKIQFINENDLFTCILNNTIVDTNDNATIITSKESAAFNADSSATASHNESSTKRHSEGKLTACSDTTISADMEQKLLLAKETIEPDYNTTMPAIPCKRKRGRPRKNKDDTTSPSISKNAKLLQSECKDMTNDDVPEQPDAASETVAVKHDTITPEGNDSKAGRTYNLRGKRINSDIMNAEKGIYKQSIRDLTDTGSMNECGASELNQDEENMCDEEEDCVPSGSENEDYKDSDTEEIDDDTRENAKSSKNKKQKTLHHKQFLHEQKGQKEIWMFSCKKCKKLFKTGTSFKRHDCRKIRSNGSYRKEPFGCRVCSVYFTSFGSLKQHMASVHKDKLFPCEVCQKKFASKSQLKRHIRVHGLDDSKKLVCEICNKSFMFKHNLLRHMSSVHEPQSEKFHCSYCGKGYSQKNGLVSHVQFVHFNLFPFVCKECKANFTKSHLLSEHMSTVHGQKGVVSTQSSRNQLYGRPEEEKLYCSFCNDSFLHKIRLVEHMHFDHSKAFPYVCGTCNQGFLARPYLMLHSLKAHGILMKAEEDLPEECIGTGEILQIISTKSGYPTTIAQTQETINTDVLLENHDTTSTPQDANSPEANATITPSNDPDASFQNTSTVLVEVASDCNTYRYVIDAPEALGESGSMAVAKDIANLLMAAEQNVQETPENQSEVSVVADTTHSNVTTDSTNSVKYFAVDVNQAGQGVLDLKTAVNTGANFVPSSLTISNNTVTGVPGHQLLNQTSDTGQVISYLDTAGVDTNIVDSNQYTIQVSNGQGNVEISDVPNEVFVTAASDVSSSSDANQVIIQSITNIAGAVPSTQDPNYIIIQGDSTNAGVTIGNNTEIVCSTDGSGVDILELAAIETVGETVQDESDDVYNNLF